MHSARRSLLSWAAPWSSTRRPVRYGRCSKTSFDGGQGSKPGSPFDFEPHAVRVSAERAFVARHGHGESREGDGTREGASRARAIVAGRPARLVCPLSARMPSADACTTSGRAAPPCPRAPPPARSARTAAGARARDEAGGAHAHAQEDEDEDEDANEYEDEYACRRYLAKAEGPGRDVLGRRAARGPSHDCPNEASAPLRGRRREIEPNLPEIVPLLAREARGRTTLARTLRLRWSVGGRLVTMAMRKLGAVRSDADGREVSDRR